MKIVCHINQGLRELCEACQAISDVTLKVAKTVSDLKRDLADAESFIVNGGMYTAEVAKTIKQYGNDLRWIQFSSSGIDSPMLHGAPDAAQALGAGAEVVGPEAARTVSLKDFFFRVFKTALEESEILTTIHIPPAAEGVRTRFKKYTCTSVETFAAVIVATAVDLDADENCIKARIGLGSVAPKSMRAIAAEDLLRGQKLTAELIAEAADVAAGETDPSSDGQGTSDYRRDMTRVWVRRLLEDTITG